MTKMKKSKPDHLQLGSKVEVTSDEDGFQNAWFAGFICQAPISSSKSPSSKKRKKRSGSKVWVQYDNLVTENELEPLSEHVKASFIRPLPPPDDPHQKLEPNDVVDAFYKDCWWTGVLMVVIGKKYYVDFEKPPDTLVLQRSDLRLHLDWVDGTWRRPEKQETTRSLFSPGASIEVNLDNEVPCISWLPAIFLRDLGTMGLNSFLVLCKSFANIEEGLHKMTVEFHQIRPLPPLRELKFDLFEKVDAFDGFRWWVGLIMKVLEGDRCIFTSMRARKVMELHLSELRPHLEWVAGQWVSKPIEMKKHVVGELKNRTTISGEKKGRPTKQRSQLQFMWTETCKMRSRRRPKHQSKNVEFSVTGLNSEVLTSSHAEISSQPIIEVEIQNDIGIEGRGKRKEPELLVANWQATVVGEQHIGFGDIALDSSTDKFEVPVTTVVEVLGEQQNGAGGVVDCQRGKGKESELLVANGQATAVGEQRNGVEDVALDCSTHKFEVPVTTGMEVSGEKQNGSGGVVDGKTEKSKLSMTIGVEISVEEQNGAGGVVGGDKSELPATSEMEVSGSDDALRDEAALVSATDYRTKEVSVDVDSMSSNGILENLTLAVRIDEMHSTENPGDSGDIGLADSLDLPFVKASSFWQQLESMEVFRKFPQRPHFQPLRKHKEIYCEGLALGYMITFVSLAERIAKFEVDTPMEFINNSLKTLSELEEMGFDVKALQSHLRELQQTQIELGQFQDQLGVVKNEITENTHEMTKIEEEIDELDKEFEKMEEKRAMLMARSVAKSSLLSMLQSEAAFINEGILSRQGKLHTLLLPPP